MRRLISVSEYFHDLENAYEEGKFEEEGEGVVNEF